MDIILSVKGISKTYTAGQVKINALNRCDIEVRKGENLPRLSAKVVQASQLC